MLENMNSSEQQEGTVFKSRRSKPDFGDECNMDEDTPKGVKPYLSLKALNFDQVDKSNSTNNKLSDRHETIDITIG